MGAKKKIKKIMLDKNIKSGTIADALEMNHQAFYNKLFRDVMKFSSVEQIANVLGCDVVFRDRETGKIYD